jgi:magnesium chelatase subunit D
LPEIEVVAGCPYPLAPGEVPTQLWPQSANRVERRPVRFVELPLGATEDRVLGTLDLERALQHGERHFEVGLLAHAHRGILYIDEVNLLGDHIVDVLLDAAAMGINTVEREGISFSHPARFILVGTMNPEEGDLRPQLLDRFGLAVEVVGPRDPAERAEIIRRRLAFEKDPTSFQPRFADAEAEIRAQIVAARTRLPQVQLDDEMLELITHICLAFDVDGMRADLVIYKTACTLAAWHGRDQATAEDVRAAAELALSHRRRRQPFEEPGLDQAQLDKVLHKHTRTPNLRQNAREPETDKEPH